MAEQQKKLPASTSKARLDFLSMVLFPLVAFCLARGFLLLIAAAHGLDPADITIWSKWDSGQYLSIATHGYQFYWADYAGHPGVAAWQGNAGWMPGYPAAIRLLMFAGLGALLSGVIISALFEFLSLLAIWQLFFNARFSWPNFLALLFAAFFPGMVYYHAVFPMSQLNFFILLCLFFAWRQRWILAGIAGALATFTYTMGLPLAAVLFTWLLLAGPQTLFRKRLTRAIAASAISLSGLAAIMLVQQVTLGKWNAFYKIQSDYGAGHSVHNPIHVLLGAISPIASSAPFIVKVAPLQTLFVALLLIGLSLFVFIRSKRGPLKLEHLLILFLLICWSFPLFLGRDQNLYRAESALFPAAILLPKMPMPIQLAVLAIGVFLAYWLSLLFFANGLM